jgi:hypothetical protein
MSRPAFRSTVAALAATAALTVAGCGVDASDSALSAAEPGGPEIAEGTFEGTGGAVFLNRAAEATAAVDTQRMSMVMATEGAPMGGDLTITAEGEFDNDAGRGAMTTDMGAAFEDLAGSGFPEGASTMEMVLDGDTVYLRSPLFSMFADEDTEWVSVPADELGSDAGFGSGAEDPGAFLEFLQRAGGEVTEVGIEEVRGVETVHVRTDLDLVAMLEDAAPEERAELEEALEGLGEGAEAFRTLPVEAWIDEGGFVRRFTMDFDFSELGGSAMGELAMTITVELYDFGEPVSITVPDPSEVSSIDPSILDGGF